MAEMCVPEDLFGNISGETAVVLAALLCCTIRMLPAPTGWAASRFTSVIDMKDTYPDLEVPPSPNNTIIPPCQRQCHDKVFPMSCVFVTLRPGNLPVPSSGYSLPLPWHGTGAPAPLLFRTRASASSPRATYVYTDCMCDIQHESVLRGA